METAVIRDIVGLGAVGISALTLLLVTWMMYRHKASSDRDRKSNADMHRDLIEVIKAMQATNDQVASAISAQRASIEANTMTLTSLGAIMGHQWSDQAEKIEGMATTLRMGLDQTRVDFSLQGEALIREMKESSEAVRSTLEETTRRLQEANTRMEDVLTTTAPLGDAALKVVASVEQLRAINASNNHQLGRLDTLSARLERLLDQNGNGTDAHVREEEVSDGA